MVLTDFCQ